MVNPSPTEVLFLLIVICYRHEHIYKLIQDNIIRADELPTKASDTKKVLGASCIILSTLSTLSNPGLDTNGVFDLVPVERLVIDEASQIKIFEFMVSHKLNFTIAHSHAPPQPVFAKFTELKKVCFFGDPKQRKSIFIQSL
jgi:hypothetical protein